LKSYGTTGWIDVAQRRCRIRSVGWVNEHSDTLAAQARAAVPAALPQAPN
jgi:hypothetical protein